MKIAIAVLSDSVRSPVISREMVEWSMPVRVDGSPSRMLLRAISGGLAGAGVPAVSYVGSRRFPFCVPRVAAEWRPSRADGASSDSEREE